MIDCQKCPVSEVCRALEKHKFEHRVWLSETQSTEPLTIMYDSQGAFIDTNYIKCRLYKIVAKTVT